MGTSKCFKCGELGHRSLEEVKDLEHEDEEPIFHQPSNEVGGDLEEEEASTLVMRKALLASKFNSEEDWLRTNIFYTTCSIGGRVYSMIIDGEVVKMWSLRRWLIS